MINCLTTPCQGELRRIISWGAKEGFLLFCVELLPALRNLLVAGPSRRGHAAAAGAAPDHALRFTRSAANPDAPASAEAEAQQDEPQDEQVKPHEQACHCAVTAFVKLLKLRLRPSRR